MYAFSSFTFIFTEYMIENHKLMFNSNSKTLTEDSENQNSSKVKNMHSTSYYYDFEMFIFSKNQVWENRRTITLIIIYSDSCLYNFKY